MSKLQDVAAQLEQKRGELAQLFNDHPEYDFSDEQIQEIRERNDELTELGKQYDKLNALDQVRQENEAKAQDMQRPINRLPTPQGQAFDPPKEQPRQSIGEWFVNTPECKAWHPARGVQAVTVDQKTLLTTTGFDPEVIRIDRIEPSPQRMEHVADLMPQGETAQASIKYMEETTFTNAAAPTAEGSDKPESTLAFTERTINVRKIATVLPVTDELMEDAPALRSYINARLMLMVRLTEDTQLVSGNGTAPNLRGLLNTVNIQTQAKGSDSTPDAVYKAMTLIMTNAYLNPDGAIFHPLDWQDIRLLKTTDGRYIWGEPSEMGPERIWGLNVVKTTAMTQNTALIGAFQYATQVFRRNEMTLAVSDQHSDFFIKNQMMLRAEERLALVVYRPTALCSVTGI